MKHLKTIVALLGCLSLAVPAVSPAFAQNRQAAKSSNRAKPQARPQTAQARPQAKPQNRAAPTRAGYPTAKASSSVNKPYNKSGNKQISNQNAYKAGQASANRNKKDVVVVNPGGGYNNGYNNNRYNNGRYYEDDDNDFLEFVGKTAAITAGVSAVAAVIGSTTKDKPSDCKESMSNGQVYLNCNGTWYQPVQSGGQSAYAVVAPPQ